MNDKIEVGEYVRLKDGTIGKVIKRDIDNHIILDVIYKGSYYLTDIEETKDIVKHSKDIIDLIEVGDYVNGEKVFKIEKDPFVKGQTNICFNRDEINYWGDRSLSQIADKEIKSIVTHEQFESMKYNFEEEEKGEMYRDERNEISK